MYGFVQITAFPTSIFVKSSYKIYWYSRLPKANGTSPNKDPTTIQWLNKDIWQFLSELITITYLICFYIQYAQ